MRRARCAIATLCLSAAPNFAQASEPESVSARFESENRATGLAMSGWEVRPSSELRGGYDSNANQVSDAPQGSPTIALRGGIEAARQLGASELSASVAVEQTWITDLPEQDTLTAGADLRGALYIGDQTTLRGAVGVERGAEAAQTAENGLIDGGSLDPYENRPRFTRVPATLAVSQDVGRFFWDAELATTWSKFDTLSTLSGVTVPQDFRNGWDHSATARLGVRIAEGYGLFARAEANVRRFDDPSADNDGFTIAGGVEFELTRILMGEITAGWARQAYAVSGEANSDFIYGAGLTWFVNPLLSLTLDAQRAFTAEQNVDALGAATSVPVLQDGVRLTAEFEPLRQWLITGRAKYVQTSSETGARDSELLEFGLGSAWAMTRTLRLNAEYAYSASEASFSGDLVRNLVTIGIVASY